MIEKPIVLSCKRILPTNDYVLTVYGSYEIEAEVSYNNDSFNPISIVDNKITISQKPIGTIFQVRIRSKKDTEYSEWYMFNRITIDSIYDTKIQYSPSPQNPNFYENDFGLFNSLSNEVIQKRGIDCIFLPKKFQKFDLILGEDPLQKFEDTYYMKMYLATVTGFEGDHDMFGRFGLHVDDIATLEINQTEFRKITNNLTPVSGDLIYIPMGNFLMEIISFNDKDPFYILGKRSKFVISVRKYDYSHEELDTTVKDINIFGDYNSTDIESENDELEDDINDLLNLNNPNIFGDK